MPRINVYFTEETAQQLKEYIQQKHGRHRAVSITIQQATKEFLERNESSKRSIPNNRNQKAN